MDAEIGAEDRLLGIAASELRARNAAVTAAEIARQPRVWAGLADLLRSQAAAIGRFLAEPLAEPDLAIVLAGAGSSGFAGGVAAAEITARTGRSARRVDTTDLVEGVGSHLDPRRPTLLVSFARSGDSPESLAAVRVVDDHCDKAWHLVLTCNSEGTLARAAGEGGTGVATGRLFALVIEPALDQAFAMTSSFSAMALAALALLTERTTEEASDILADMARRADQVLGRASEIRALAERRPSRVVYLGAGPHRDAAAECALKLLELTDGEVVAVSWSPLAFRHGPKTIVEDGTLVVSFLSATEFARSYGLDMARELRADGRATSVMLATGPVDDQASAVVFVLDAEPWPWGDGWLAVLHVVWGQVFAFMSSIARDHAVDAPSASGEVNRVVRNVTIYP